MTHFEIIEFIETQILQAQNGYHVETNKLDFKRKWYSLDSEQEVFEFLKDVCAIANSYGGGSGFLVLGIDGNGTPFNSPFVESKLKDDNALYGLIKSKVDRPFNIELIEHKLTTGETINIIHIPPTQEKPHVIRCYKKGNTEFLNEIFIRRSSSIERASKADIDLMYAEKGSILIERSVSVNINLTNVKATFMNNEGSGEILFDIELLLENTGIRLINTLKVELNMTLRSPVLLADNKNVVLTTFTELSITPGAITKQRIHFKFNPNLRRSECAELVNFFNDLREKSEFVELNYLNILLSDGTYMRRTINTIFTGEMKHIPRVNIRD